MIVRVEVEKNMDKDMEDFEKDLSDLINRHSLENYFNMPDFLMAQQLTDNLRAAIRVYRQNKKWHEN